MSAFAVANHIFDRLKLSQDIHSRIQQRRLRYLGHVSRMGQDRYKKLSLEGYVYKASEDEGYLRKNGSIKS